MDFHNEPTPIFDELIARLGDPIPVPAIDRSYATIVAQATGAATALPAPSGQRRAMSAVQSAS